MSASPIAELGSRRGEEAAHGEGARSMFQRIAPSYDLLNRLLSGGMDRRWRRRAVRALEGAPPGPVLDLCAGTMDLTALLAEARPSERIVAVDFCAAMLEAGRQKAPRAEVVVADAMEMPFEDRSFGAAICGFGMRNLADPARGLREVLRVLEPGGVFVTLELFRPVRLETRAFHALYARIVLPSVGGWVSGDRSAYRYLSRSMAGFCSRAGYEQLALDAGFARAEGADLTLGVASFVRAEAPR